MSQVQIPVRVSVITPFLNAEPFLKETIESVLSQSYDAWELFLIDDGSTEGSTEIARGYAEQYPEKIYYLEHEGHRNLGPSASRNLGIVHARGEYIAFLDADDLWVPQRLEKQVSFLDAHPEIALLGSWYSLIDEHGSCLEKVRPPCDYQELGWALFFANPFATSAVMIRREPVLGRVGLHDESYAYAQDYDLWCRIADHLPVANLPDFLACRRVHSASLTWIHPDAGPEFRQLRLARMAPLLGWDEVDLAARDPLPSAITALDNGWAQSFEPAVLSQAAEDMLKLHGVFFAREGLAPGEIQKREQILRSRIAVNLVMLTVFCRSGGLAVRLDLLSRAWRLKPQAFLRARTLARAGRAIAGAYIPRLRVAPGIAT